MMPGTTMQASRVRSSNTGGAMAYGVARRYPSKPSPAVPIQTDHRATQQLKC